MKKFIAVIILLLGSLHTVTAYASQLTFGIVPQQSAKRLATLWTPILQHLSQETGLDIVFSTAKDIPTFEQRLKNGEYDIAYMNPYHYVVFSQQPGYLALAKQKDKRIKGVIVANAKSDIRSIQDLSGKRLAFPAPAAFAASILPRAELKQHGVEFTPQYVLSHDSVYLNVSKAFFIAGGGITRTLSNMPDAVKQKLKVIWETAEYTPHAVATHPNVDRLVRQKVLAALVAMGQTPKGKTLLKSINFKGFEDAKNSDWNDVRALNINTLDVSEK
jgi:phosphonate transport system substrate-binding protein